MNDQVQNNDNNYDDDDAIAVPKAVPLNFCPNE